MRRIRFGTIGDVYEAFPALAEAVPPGAEDEPPIDHVERLVREGRHGDAIAVFAFLLPRREAVWWGCRCVMSAGDVVEASDRRSWAIAANWVRSPDEQRRRAALEDGDTAAQSRPTTWLARAAAWSGGSMVLSETGTVLPPPDLTARALRAGLSISLGVHSDVKASLERSFVDHGLEIARAETDLADDLAEFQKRLVAKA
jgi:hypothetical protein